MDTAFVIGNGESRKIFPIDTLKGKGVVYGCNAIYRDHPKLCDHIVAVNPPMYEELTKWHNWEEQNAYMSFQKKRDASRFWLAIGVNSMGNR